MGENILEMVNGNMLQQFNSKHVSIMGLVTNVNPNGLTFDVRSVDDVLVKVNLRKPFRDALEGYVEVHGIAQGGCTVICDDFVLLSPQKDEFDSAAHNTLVLLLQSIPDIWKTMSGDAAV